MLLVQMATTRLGTCGFSSPNKPDEGRRLNGEQPASIRLPASAERTAPPRIRTAGCALGMPPWFDMTVCVSNGPRRWENHFVRMLKGETHDLES